MDLTLDDDQRLLADSARQLFERTYPTTARRIEELPERSSAELWTQAVDLGWPGIALPEACGGAGYGLLELAILAEELGRAAVTLPLLSSYAATLPLVSAGTAAQQARWLPPLTTGATLATLALLEPGGGNERPAVFGHPGRGRLDALGHQARGGVRRRRRRPARHRRPRRRAHVARRARRDCDRDHPHPPPRALAGAARCGHVHRCRDHSDRRGGGARRRGTTRRGRARASQRARHRVRRRPVQARRSRWRSTTPPTGSSSVGRSV